MRFLEIVIPRVSLMLIACLICASGSVPLLAADRPNIVLIFADDLGWQEPGYAGSDFCETPHLDRLARDGMVFRHAYSSAGNCAPSRACMLSGQYTPRHSVYAVGSTKRGPVDLMRMIPIGNKASLPLSTVTLGEAMKQAGYVTGMFGKCHLTDSKNGKSERSGFDVVKVSQHGLNSDDPDDPKGIFSITAAACEFIAANQQRPFFAYLPHYAVHSRLQGRKATLKHFQSKTAGEKHHDPLFAACLADLDTGVGLVLKKLAELGLEENTLVLFTSDNGGTAVSQEPLRGKKGCYYEGGIRVPMIVRWPGTVAPGTTCDVPVINVDFFPSFLAVAGAEQPSSLLDGENLLPLFQGQPALKRSAVFWHFPGYLNGPVPRGRDPIFRTRPVSVIRHGDWKLHLYHEEWQLDGGRDRIDSNNAIELYNLASDPGEHHNLAGRQRAKRDELLDELLAWINRVPAPLPEQRNPQWQPQ
ncbi:sulfatase-like hydrolase/transferase [bacterium]|nr:sulfatase-like hydrolase/transferase [bacterium]